MLSVLPILQNVLTSDIVCKNYEYPVFAKITKINLYIHLQEYSEHAINFIEQARYRHSM